MTFDMVRTPLLVVYTTLARAWFRRRFKRRPTYVGVFRHTEPLCCPALCASVLNLWDGYSCIPLTNDPSCKRGYRLNAPVSTPPIRGPLRRRLRPQVPMELPPLLRRAVDRVERRAAHACLFCGASVRRSARASRTPCTAYRRAVVTLRLKSHSAPRRIGSGVVVRRKTVARRLLTFVHTVIPDHAGNSQAIVGKNLCTPSGLRGPMAGDIAPCLHCRLVAEKESDSILPGSVKLSKRSTEINPSIFSSIGRSEAAMSR